MLRSIPRQLALSYLGIVILCLGLAGGAVLGLVRAQTMHRLVDELEQEASFLATLLGRQEWPPSLKHSERRLLAVTMIRFSLDSLILVDRDGNVIDSSLMRIPLVRQVGAATARPEIEQALQGQPATSVRRVPPLDPSAAEAPEISVLFTAVPVMRQGRIAGALAMRRPLADVDLFLLTLARTLIWLGIAAAVVACVVAIWLARLLTRPIQRLGAAATRIAEGHLDERIAAHGTVELRNLADAFNHMAEALEAQERSRAQFISDASHELKTPLSSLKALLEALERGAATDPERAARFIALMNGEVDRLHGLVRDMLDLHRMEAGIQRELVDVKALLADVAEQVRPSLPPHAVTVDAPDGLTVDADPARVRQVLLNLTANATRALDGRPDPRLVLRAKALSEVDVRHTEVISEVDSRRAEVPRPCIIEVEDNGPGIPADKRERVFERFYRLDEGRARSEGGTGLGLAIARSIVEAHGGRIWIEDGTPMRVAFTLPRQPIPIRRP